MAVNWSYYDKEEFNQIDKKYLPAKGEGDNMATQIVTAVNKLIYKWYNDGDVYDNTYHLTGWCNDLSTYANWLYTYVLETKNILTKIENCWNDSDYEDLLKELCDTTQTMEFLANYETRDKVDSIYECDGPFEFREDYDEDEDEDDYWGYDDEDDEEDW